jgi:DNA-binding MarR family transcriptional regulator
MDNIYQEPWEDSLEPLAKDIDNCALKLRENGLLPSLRTIVIFTLAVKEYSSSWLKKKSVGAGGFGLLHTLITNGGRMTPTQIAKELVRTKYAVTRITDALEKEGLVRREPFGYDRRTRDIIVTRTGIKLVIEFVDYFQEYIIPKISGELDENQIKDLVALVEQLKSTRITDNS